MSDKKEQIYPAISNFHVNFKKSLRKVRYGKTMAYPLLGTKIVIDEEKVLREKKYKLDVIYEYLDKLAKQCDLIKIDKNTFHAKGDEKDLANLALFVCKYAVKNEWLTKNIKEWIWISERSGNEDMIARFKREKMGVWE